MEMQMEAPALRAYLVDDEPLAIERLKRLLVPFEGLRIVGSATDPTEAFSFLSQTDEEPVDVLFLDIQMPGMNGFELLARLPVQPFVIFTTAFDEYALKAFEVNSIDYLVKPIDVELLERALKKLERLRPVVKPEWQQSPQLPALLQELAASLRGGGLSYPHRIASRVGERISLIDVASVTHFIAHDKLTYAVVDGHRHAVDQTIAELEARLDPDKFLRIHRAALVHLDWIQELNAWFAGKVVLTLKDKQRTQLPVARDRVRILKTRLGM